MLPSQGAPAIPRSRGGREVDRVRPKHEPSSPLSAVFAGVRVDSSPIAVNRRTRKRQMGHPEAYRDPRGLVEPRLSQPPARSTASSAAPSGAELFRGSTGIAETRTPFPGDGYPASDGGSRPSAGNPSSLSQRVRSHQRRLKPDRRRSRRARRHARPFPAPSAVSPRLSAAA